jgi:hypothetical protein
MDGRFDVAMGSLPVLFRIRSIWTIRTLLFDLAPGSTIRIRLGAALGRTFGARCRWKANRRGWDTRWRSNDDKVEQDMAEGNIVRNTSEKYTHVVSAINGDYVLTSDGWWVTIDDVIL